MTYRHSFPEGLLRASFSAHYAAGTVIIKQGEPVDKVSLVEDGVLKRTHVGQNGKEVIANLILRGDVVGTACSLLQKPSTVSVVCANDTALRHVRAKDFRQLIEQGLSSEWVRRVLCLECWSLTDYLVHAKSSSARTRLLAILDRLAQVLGAAESDGHTRIRLPLLHWELAQLLGVTPEHLSRVLHLLNREGLLICEPGWLVLSDRSEAG